MNNRVLITGASGLVGAALAEALEQAGTEVVRFDIKADGAAHGDVCDAGRLGEAAAAVDGIVHLAAVSRVVWGENDPPLCQRTNIGGVKNVLDGAARSARSPWVIFSSSREVYGQPDAMPVDESFPLRPMNVYGHSKADGEALVNAAREDGMRACIIRLSNVYGSIADHVDRVVPAFARAAAFGEEIRIDGAGHTFDFTHIDDVTRGIASLVAQLSGGAPAPAPIHFVSGEATTLGELAEMAIAVAQTDTPIRHAPPRNFDVERFYGTYARAGELLGWAPGIALRDGLERLIGDYRAAAA